MALTEKAFQAQVIELAQLAGWLVMHTRSVQQFDGRWLTPLQGDPGYPDLTLAKGGRVVFAELKVGRNKLTADQVLWLDALPGSVVWRPDDWDQIEETLL